VLTPEEAMVEARALSAAGQRVGVLFGPERTGLENADIHPAQAIVTVPVNPDFPSLNLAQCTLLMAYEWGRLTAPPPAAPAIDRAPAIEIAHLGDHYEDRLEAAGFFFPPDKAEGMKANLRAMWARLGLTRPEVQTLHGILRKLARKPPSP
jgi:tRNA/rRNA methyltransferase